MMRRFEHGGNLAAHPGALDFSASLNPLGLPESAREVLRRNVDAFSGYPDPDCQELTSAIAMFERVREPWVLPCAGATDAFARICTVRRPRQILTCAPSYSGYEQAAEQHGARIVTVTLDESDGFVPTPSLADSIAEGIDLIFLANPNNPTGQLLPREVLLACLSRAREVGTLVVLDECFIDLTGCAGSTDLLAEHPHLVLVKALTKTFSLAGLRVGYVLCADTTLLGTLRDAGQPWAVSVPAQLAGVACLPDDAYLQRSRKLICAERKRLAASLEALGLHVVPSVANYLLFWAPRNVTGDLLEEGVLVRSCENFRSLDGHWHRVAVRLPAENDQLIAALERVMTCRRSH